MFLSDAICLGSDHLQVDIIRSSVCNSTAVSDYVLTKASNILQLNLHMRLNLSCYCVTIVLMTVSNFFLLLNKDLFTRLKSLTTILLELYLLLLSFLLNLFSQYYICKEKHCDRLLFSFVLIEITILTKYL